MSQKLSLQCCFVWTCPTGLYYLYHHTVACSNREVFKYGLSSTEGRKQNNWLSDDTALLITLNKCSEPDNTLVPIKIMYGLVFNINFLQNASPAYFILFHLMFLNGFCIIWSSSVVLQSSLAEPHFCHNLTSLVPPAPLFMKEADWLRINGKLRPLEKNADYRRLERWKISEMN